VLGCPGVLTDLILAILHHLAIVSLIALLAFESALLRPGITAENLSRLTRIDAAYGMTAGSSSSSVSAG
jgi:putative membrane protein